MIVRVAKEGTKNHLVMKVMRRKMKRNTREDERVEIFQKVEVVGEREGERKGYMVR